MLKMNQVHDNPQEHRFELEVDGETAYTVYQKQGDTLVLSTPKCPPTNAVKGSLACLSGARCKGCARLGRR